MQGILQDLSRTKSPRQPTGLSNKSNTGEAENIPELTGLLKSESFNAVRLRLREHGRKAAFSCLFYGPPGTGKTESVYQIARAAQRDIVQMNIAETKSLWFGESERLIKGIFDDYLEGRNVR
jgi:SpoVK/Ycf46/Vps4 family AAA+-type ATPase